LAVVRDTSGAPRHDSNYEWVAANMTGTLLGFAIIAAGAFVAWLYQQWARADADSLKKMSEREFQKSQPNRKAGAARVAGSGAARDKRNNAPHFGRR